jgi:hypothetical protein
VPDLNLDLNFFDHPKTRRLVGLLGRGAEILPIKLWCACGRLHPESGRLTDYSPQEIESMVDWWGKAGDAVAALVKVGFLSSDATGYEITGWLEHQGHIAAFRKRAKVAARARWGCLPDATSIASSNGKHCPIQPTNQERPPLPPEGVGVRPKRRKTSKKSPVEDPPGFEKFWAAWPAHRRKYDRESCVKRWESAGCEKIADLIMTPTNPRTPSAARTRRPRQARRAQGQEA